MEPILQVENIRKIYKKKNSSIFSKAVEFAAVDGISFSVYEGKSLGIVGESGSGKSTVCDIAGGMKKATSGQIKYYGKDISALSKNEYKKYRKDVQFIFQSPKDSLHPFYNVQENLLEPLRVFTKKFNSKDALLKIKETLTLVNLDENYLQKYPQELSGGQAQRVAIARAILVEPKVIICDEAVSALDLSVQAQILELLNKLKSKTSYIFISHDIAAVNEISDYTLVMRDGKVVEENITDELIQNPQDEYTKILINSSFFFEEG